jgi:methylated-DNA-[protein]-cysteine S-methyltransferase
VPAPERALFYGSLESPLGTLLVAGDGERLHRIVLPGEARARAIPAGWRRNDTRFAEAFHQLRAYFAGALTRFELPLHPGGTPFQTAVWAALREIPYGRTTTYGALARRLGRPSAYRAVGAANGANPLPIVVPCHRVIGAGGALTGFGGGLPAKRFLLDLEKGVRSG